MRYGTPPGLPSPGTPAFDPKPIGT
jgi:hypothetical protein